MATSSTNEFSSADVKKLKHLRSALLEGIKKCGEVVHAKSGMAGKTIIHLKQQSLQYVNELNAQITVLSSSDVNNMETINEQPEDKINEHKEKTPEQFVLKLCRKMDISVIGVYRKILKDKLMNESLKRMMRYQMDGMMQTTLQLKLLSKFLHDQ
ncbi:MAG TPA: hypothetical protein VMT76_16935 [Puia sp.]|nr:hypothetical protein [Puia sp.]